MELGLRIESAFFEGACVAVARSLVGTTLVRTLPDRRRLVGRIVEVEAYLGDGTDPAAHSHRGQTPRNRSMFGPAGRVYAYRCYGLHTCLNVVCEPAGRAAAVLLRAIEPLEGLEAMRAHRGFARDAGPTTRPRSDYESARGPGRLAQALGVDVSCDGQSATHPGGPFRLHQPPAGSAPPKVEVGGRVGLSVAADLPYRFFEADSRWVSPYRTGGRKRPAAH